jgi:hypothetical protein
MESAVQPHGAATSARTRREHDNAIDVVAKLHREIGNHALHGLLEAGQELSGASGGPDFSTEFEWVADPSHSVTTATVEWPMIAQPLVSAYPDESLRASLSTK